MTMDVCMCSHAAITEAHLVPADLEAPSKAICSYCTWAATVSCNVDLESTKAEAQSRDQSLVG